MTQKLSEISIISVSNSSPPGQNGCHFTDIFKGIVLNENIRISIQISLKFVPKGPIDNKSAAPVRRQAITWTNADPVHRWIYTALGGDEVIMET